MPALPLAALLAAPPTAVGHASFVGAAPGPGERLEVSPQRVVLSFTEPLNGRLSKVVLREASGDEVVETAREKAARDRLVLRPLAPLRRGAYRLEWHTVSTLDGHALEGAFSFGVRASAGGGVHVLQQSPLARAGWARVLARAVLYLTLLPFTAALLLRVLLSATWLAPAGLDSADRGGLHLRERRLTRDIGWLAAGAAAVATMLEAADAADGFAPAGLRDFLLANVAGVARVAAVLLVVAAVVACGRRPRLAAGFVALALGALAASGHAASSQPRLPSVLNDWLHLGAGAVWLGGLAMILVVWAPTLRRGGRRARMALARHVLPRFGRVALSAFLVAATSGLAGLVQQLGHVSALWQTDYGRVLAVKIGLVVLIAAASYVHAMRLRPRLLAASSRVANDLERRHWRLVRSQPALAGGVVAAVAVLVTFPLPPRQLGDAGDEARAATPVCDPCPLPTPARGELAVAEGAGSHLVAGWIRRDRRGLTGTVRVLDSKGKPARAPFGVRGARQRSCGPGCRRFETRGGAAVLRVAVTERGSRFVAELPARWHRGREARARRLLARAQATMRRLRSVHEVEEVTSGPGSYARTHYRVRAPDRMAYTTNLGIESVIVGRRQWFRSPSLSWEARDYGAGLAFRTRSWFRWTTYARAVRLLDLRRVRGRPVAELALADLATPVWFRLVVDRRTLRILRARMIAEAHFMTQRYRAFNRPLTIRPPGYAR